MTAALLGIDPYCGDSVLLIVDADGTKRCTDSCSLQALRSSIKGEHPKLPDFQSRGSTFGRTIAVLKNASPVWHVLAEILE